MPKVDRTRIDYMPGDAACDALALARDMFPKLRTQALLDRLLITAVSALHHAVQHKPWQPPSIWGTDRDRWKLPVALQSKESAECSSMK